MKAKHSKLHTRLVVLFWLNIITVAVVFLGLLYSKGPDFGNIPGNVTFERYAIIFTLASIPLALKLFHNMLQKYKSLSEDQYLSKYTGLYIIRILLLDVIIVMNMIGFYLYEANNFIYMNIVVIFAIMFCYPSKDSLNNLTNKIESENESSLDDEINETNRNEK